MRVGGWIGAGAALAAGLAVLVIFFVLTGHDPAMALAAMWRGAFGSWFALTSGTLIRAVPIALIALGFTVAYRAGALNIGGEGQFYAGAIAATWAGLRLGSWSGALAIPVTLTAAFAAGAVWITLPAVLRRRFGVQEVISTLLLNFVAEAAVSYAVQGPLQESQTHLSAERRAAGVTAPAAAVRHAAARGGAPRGDGGRRAGVGVLAHPARVRAAGVGGSGRAPQW
jgi:simple sugar transport system permease protein